MIIVMHSEFTDQQLERVMDEVRNAGLKPVLQQGTERSVIEVLGEVQSMVDAGKDESHFNSFPGVDWVRRISKPYKRASRECKAHNTIVTVGKARIGRPGHPVIMGGPCSVESLPLMHEVGSTLQQLGVEILRGGAFKPRSTPYSFQGSGEDGLKILREVGDSYDLPIVTEVMSDSQVELISRYADILQVGARNSQNFTLLKALAETKKPVLLKNGMAGTAKDLLQSAEYILKDGKRNVILCLRGFVTHEQEAVRNTLGMGVISWLKRETHLPIIVDPSHTTGRWETILPVSLAAIAEGADGLIIETHPRPTEAISDANQTLNLHDFGELLRQVRALAGFLTSTAQPALTPA